MTIKNQYRVQISENTNVYVNSERGALSVVETEEKNGRRLIGTKVETLPVDPVFAEHWGHTHNVWHVWIMRLDAE